MNSISPCRSMPLLRHVLVLLILSCSGGCQSRIELAAMTALHGAGNFASAANLALSEDAVAYRGKGHTQMLWQLEAGKVLQDAGRPAQSRTALRAARQLGDRYSMAARISISEELSSIAINDTVRNYRGTSVDLIMLECYEAINSLALGDMEEAQVAARRAIDRQEDARFEHRQRLQRVQEESQKHRGINTSIEGVLADQGIDPGPGASAYLNPLASYLSALLQYATGDGDDRARAEVDLRRASSMVPDNTYLAEDLAGELYAAAYRGEAQVVVLLENGLAPRVTSRKIRVRRGWNDITSIPIPIMVEPVPEISSFRVTGEGVTESRSLLLVDIARMVRKEYHGRLPGIILRTLLSYAAKEKLKKKAKEKKGDTGEFLASIFQFATAVADTRSWRSMGSEVLMVRCRRPADGILDMVVLDGTGLESHRRALSIPEARLVLVYARAVKSNHVQYQVLQILQ